MRNLNYMPLYPWQGGLNTSVDPLILDPSQLVVADNIIFTYSGSRKKRGGQAHYNTNPVSGASTANFVYLKDYWANVSTTKKEFLVGVTDNGKVWRSPFNGTWSSMSTMTLSVTQGGVTSTVIGNNLVIGFQGNNGLPKVWVAQNTSANLVNLSASSGSLPFTSAWIVTSMLERLVVAGDPSNPDRVYFSETANYQGWTQATSAGFARVIKVGEGDGDPSGITAVFPGTGGDNILYVAKRKRLYRIDCSDPNQSNWPVQLISNEIGVVSPNSVATIDQRDIMFASDRGVHSVNQIIKTTAIVGGEFLSFPISYDYANVIDASERPGMSAVWVPSLNSYLLGCKRSGVSTFETVYGFNYELQQWFRWTGVPSNFLMRRLNKSTGADELYAGGQTGYVNQLNQTALNDFGAAIPMTIKTAFISPNMVPLAECQFTNLACIYRAHENSSFTVTYSIDGLYGNTVSFPQRFVGENILGTTLLGTSFLMGAIQAIKPVWNHLSIGEGNSIQLTFTQNGVNQDFELFGIVLEYRGDGAAENAFRSSVYSS